MMPTLMLQWLMQRSDRNYIQWKLNYGCDTPAKVLPIQLLRIGSPDISAAMLLRCGGNELHLGLSLWEVFSFSMVGVCALATDRCDPNAGRAEA